jgi:peptidoglycan L-alanyl-D-glutamate endopeptidase CwlK
MSQVIEQAAFLKDVILLLQKANELGFTVTGGELFRTPEQQQIYVKTGRSTTMASNHLRRCAIDLNIFKDNTLVYDIEILRPLGEYWRSLNSKNDWGGFWKSFKDVPHFERKP